MARIEKGDYNMLEIMENLPATELDAFKWTSVMCSKIASKDTLRPVLCGVYYDNGFACCTDAHSMVVRRYDKIDNAFEGKIVTTNKKLGLLYNKSVDGSIIEGRYPNYRGVVGKTKYKFTLSSEEVNTLKKNITKYLEQSKEENFNKIVEFSYEGKPYVLKIPYLLNLLSIAISAKTECVDFYLPESKGEYTTACYAVFGSVEMLCMPNVAGTLPTDKSFDLEKVIDKLSSVKKEIITTKAHKQNKNPLLSFIEKNKGGEYDYVFAKDDKKFFVSDSFYMIELPNNEKNKEILDFVEGQKNLKNLPSVVSCEAIMNAKEGYKPFDADDFLKKSKNFFEVQEEEIKRHFIDITFRNAMEDDEQLQKKVIESGIDTKNYDDVIKFLSNGVWKYLIPSPKPKFGRVYSNVKKEILQGEVVLLDGKGTSTTFFFNESYNRIKYGIYNIIGIFKQLGYDDILCSLFHLKVIFSTKNGDLKVAFMGCEPTLHPQIQFPYTIKGEVVTQESISNEKELFSMLKKALEKQDIPVSFGDEKETIEQLKREGSNEKDIEFSLTETEEDLDEDSEEFYQDSLPLDFDAELNELEQKIVSLEKENEHLKMLQKKVCELKEEYGSEFLSKIDSKDRKELLQMLKNC